jgi:DNA-damage-inducible protein J
MAQTNVNIRMDEGVKRQFDLICTELGLNMSTAFNMFAKTVVRQNKIPFELVVDPFFNEFNMERLRYAIANRGKGTITKTMEELEAMSADE